ncbi:hypothetical protein BSL78_28514 [Apostichopus japonicus]|uniref:Uncharacterized protein n=1 Tax=Stichopus japonicus TaxID=307972 RepID=A0A2G8JFY5_STIJA|nr:hypothetical protein BSL78_28514 [Apostichopus japonicus]
MPRQFTIKDYESSTDVFYTEIVTELVTEIDDFVTSENTTVTPKYRGSSSSVPTNREPSEPKDDDTPVRVKNRPIRDGDAGLWIAIAVVCVAAIVVVFLLLASVVLRWRRAEESSYNLERSENDHTNPAFEAGEIAGLEPANGMHEVSIGLTTFADEESKSVL